MLLESPIHGADVTYFDYEAITVADTAIGFTTATIAPTGEKSAHVAYITCETASVRWTMDGTTPTSTVGHLLAVNDVLQITGISNVAAFRAIRVTDSASLKVSYGRIL